MDFKRNGMSIKSRREVEQLIWVRNISVIGKRWPRSFAEGLTD